MPEEKRNKILDMISFDTECVKMELAKLTAVLSGLIADVLVALDTTSPNENTTFH